MDSSDHSTFDVSNLRVVRSGHEILKSISFRAAPGELIGLLGPSGSGKSTLMRSLLGVQAITDGSARIMNCAAGSRSLRGKLGYMAQSAAVYLDLTVEENIRYFTGVLAQGPSEVARVMDVVALTPFADRLVRFVVRRRARARVTGRRPRGISARADPGRADRGTGPDTASRPLAHVRRPREERCHGHRVEPRDG